MIRVNKMKHLVSFSRFIVRLSQNPQLRVFQHSCIASGFQLLIECLLKAKRLSEIIAANIDVRISNFVRKAYLYATMRLLKIVAVILLTGMLGLAAILPPLGENLEQGGLDLLFRLRGTCKPPPEVVIIAIDNFSAESLSIHQLRKWPRDLHARLVGALAGSGAKVIILDLFMEHEQSQEGDRRFAAAMKAAGNVVLSQSIVSSVIQLEDSKAAPGGYVNLEQIVSPLPLFAESPAALGPFPLPRTLSKFMKCWMFKDEAGGCPTMPVVAFHVFNLDRPDYPAGMMSQDHLAAGNTGTGTSTPANHIDQVIRGLRDTFRNNPKLSEDIIRGKETLEARGGGAINQTGTSRNERC